MTTAGSAKIITGGAQVKGRATWTAVKRSVCDNCGGCWWDTKQLPPTPPRGVYLCSCSKGWTGTTTDLGVIADSGPLGWLRPLWLLGQAITRRFNDFKARFA